MEPSDPLVEAVRVMTSSLEFVGSKLDWLIERNAVLESSVAALNLVLSMKNGQIKELTAERDDLVKQLAAADQHIAAMDAGHEDYT